jgi:dihydropteroate synthase
MHYPLRLISSHSRRILEKHLSRARVDPEGIRIIEQKAENLIIRVDNVPAAAANIIKQQLLSLGGDAAVHRDVIKGKPEESAVYIVANRRQISKLTGKLANQPFGLPGLGKEISKLLHTRNHPPERIKLKDGEIDLTGGPVIMGVLNVTPDSFSDGGLYIEPEKSYERALEMVEEGASIIDVGGESSRPGSKGLSAREELERITPVLEMLAGKIPVPLSIDTMKAEVARVAMESGASIINDISGLRHDPEMTQTAIETDAAVVVMHMQGTPETMQRNPHYEDPVSEILEWMDGRTKKLISLGFDNEKIIIDPGIGFGKRLRDNLDIIEEIGDFQSLGFPVLVGHSRKSFIGTITGRDTGERLWGGFAALGKCLDGGVQIARVHDVKETADFIRVWKAIERKGNGS